VSVKATNHVRRLRGLNFAEGRAAFVLADHANHKTGEITISMQTLKEECELAFRQTASDIVGRLIEWKVFLAPHPSKGRKPTTLYVNYDLGNCDSPIKVAPLSNRNSPVAVNRNAPITVGQTQPQSEGSSSTVQPQSEMTSTAIPGLHKGVKKEKERKEEAPATPSPSIFTGQHFSVTQKQDALLGEAFPWVDRAIEYRKADSWLEANPERRPKKSSRFLHNWFSRIAQPKGKNDAKSKTGAVSPDNDRLAAVQDRERREREQVN